MTSKKDVTGLCALQAMRTNLLEIRLAEARLDSCMSVAPWLLTDLYDDMMELAKKVRELDDKVERKFRDLSNGMVEEEE